MINIIFFIYKVSRKSLGKKRFEYLVVCRRNRLIISLKMNHGSLLIFIVKTLANRFLKYHFYLLTFISYKNTICLSPWTKMKNIAIFSMTFSYYFEVHMMWRNIFIWLLSHYYVIFECYLFVCKDLLNTNYDIIYTLLH